MKTLVCLSGAALLMAGCGTTGPDRVARTDEGTRAYQVEEQPQANVTASGTVMRGAYDPRTAPTGAFTGKETTQDQIGQFPTPPRESTMTTVHEPVEAADAPDSTEPGATEPPQVGSGIVPPREGAGAGTLGQSGIYPHRPVTGSTIMSQPVTPLDPPTAETAPTLSEPLTGTGSAPGVQTETQSPRVDLPATSALEPGDSSIGDASPTGETTLDTITLRVREALSTGRPGTISRLTPERLQNIEIEARNDAVTLRGDVRSETEKLMIERRVRSIQGVGSVNNQLRVVSPTRPGQVDATSPAERADPLYPEK